MRCDYKNINNSNQIRKYKQLKEGKKKERKQYLFSFCVLAPRQLFPSRDSDSCCSTHVHFHQFFQLINFMSYVPSIIVNNQIFLEVTLVLPNIYKKNSSASTFTYTSLFKMVALKPSSNWQDNPESEPVPEIYLRQRQRLKLK